MKLFDYFNKAISLIRKNSKRPVIDRFEGLKNNNNIKIGIGCNLEALSIVSQKFTPGNLNIEIGDNCFLMGTITLHSEKAKVKIGNRVFIGPNTTLFCYDNIEIGDDVMFSWGCTVIDTNAHSLSSLERKDDVLDWLKGPEFKNWSVVLSKPVVVNNKSWVGFNSIIMKGVILGEGTVVASGSVVTKSTQPFSIVGGNPANFIKHTD